eukprot:2484073-Alexandrium_andersonii.AAC.1
MLLSPTYDPSAGAEEQGRRVAETLSEITRTVNSLIERQSAYDGRLIGVETSQRSLAGGASEAVTSLINQARVEFQAQGSS